MVEQFHLYDLLLSLKYFIYVSKFEQTTHIPHYIPPKHCELVCGATPTTPHYYIGIVYSLLLDTRFITTNQ